MGPSTRQIVFLLTLLVGISDNLLAQEDTSQVVPAVKDTFAIPDPVPNSTDPKATAQKSVLDYDIVYDALDSIPSSPDNSVIELYNQAVIEYGGMKIEAGYIRIEFEKSEIYATGLTDSNGVMTQKPIFTEAGKTYRADAMRYNFETGKARINKVITQEGEGFLHGEKIKKTAGAAFFVKNASYTTCSHEHPHFRIRTPKAKVIPGEKVVTQFAFLELFDIPTPLMLPFGFFPTTDKRKSGIIIPTYGSSQFRGYFLQRGGFYWAASDYFDLSLTGDIYTKGGYGLQGQTAYRVRYKFSGNLNVNYNLLRFGREEFAPFLPGAFNNQSDFSIRWNHKQDAKANPNFNFSANVNIATSQFFQITSINPDQVLQNRLNSSVSFTKRWAGRPFNLSVTLNHSQNNRTQDLTLTLPNINFSVNRFFPFKSEGGIVGNKKWYEEIGITYTSNAKNQIQTRLDKPVFTETVFRDSSRMGIQHSIPISANYKVFKFFVFNPSINYTERWYPNKLEFAFDSASNRVVVVDTINGFFANRNFSTNAQLSTKLYGLWRYKGFLRAVRHVMTPRIGFNFQPDFSTPFWGYYEEIQSDTLGNTTLVNPYRNGVYGSAGSGMSGAITFGIQNTLEAKIRDRSDSTGLKKIKILERFSVDGNHNLAAEQFKWSTIRVAASSSMFDRLITLNYNASLDPYAYDETLNQRVNEFAISQGGPLFRVTSQRFTAGTRLDPRTFESKKKDKDKDKENKDDSADPTTGAGALGITEGDIDYYRLPGYVDFNVPWSVNMNYNLSYNNSGGGEPTIRQSVDISGDMDLTEGWKIGFRTGYDIEAQDFTFTSFNFYRDLHCWTMSCSWVPFGFQQTYMLTIRVKSSILQDLKLERRRGVGDFQR